jgi:hypothetical protein
LRIGFIVFATTTDLRSKQVAFLSVTKITEGDRKRESLIRFRQTPSAFHRVHNETLTAVAMRVRNPHCSPVGINS